MICGDLQIPKLAEAQIDRFQYPSMFYHVGRNVALEAKIFLDGGPWSVTWSSGGCMFGHVL